MYLIISHSNFNYTILVASIHVPIVDVEFATTDCNVPPVYVAFTVRTGVKELAEEYVKLIL